MKVLSAQKIEEIVTHDQAFLNSLLSYGVYSSREWTLEKHEGNNPVLEALKKANTSPTDVTQKKAYELCASFFINDKFQPVDLAMNSQGNYHSERYGFSTEFNTRTGEYKALNNLAKAGIFTSKNPDNTHTLHLSFRGTDTDARTFKEFVTDAYLDMSAYYDSFKPLEKAILSYVGNPDNKISQIHISGHSLGGAMVPEFFKSPEVKKCAIPMKGFTYGAPGNSKKSFYDIFPSLYHAINNGKFLALGKSILKSFSPVNTKILDSRITQYNHSGDLIPRVAKAVYETEGVNITLEDVANKTSHDSFLLTGKASLALNHKYYTNLFSKALDYTRFYLIEKPTDYLQKAFSCQFHDMLRYTINIEHKALKMANGLSYTSHINEFNNYKKVYENTQDYMDKICNHEPKGFSLKSKEVISDLIGKNIGAFYAKNIQEQLLGLPLDITVVSAKTGYILKKF